MKDKNSKEKGKAIKKEIIMTLETVFITMFIVTLIFTYIFKIAVVDGSSMKNTLNPEDTIMASAMFFTPEAGDIVLVNAYDAYLLDDEGNLICETGLGKQIVKRIIATGGQTVDIDFEQGAIYVDGKQLNEPYITGLTHMDEGAFTGKYPITVPEGYVFVMGDNRGISKDSRSDEIGFVSEESIYGQVIMRLTPLDSFGFID